MDSDPRYQWIERAIVSSLNSRKETMASFTENEENKFVLSFFFVANSKMNDNKNGC